MTTSVYRTHQALLHPLHAVLVAGAMSLFLGALLSDWAYASSAQIQWANFASWLIAGALVFTGFATLWALLRLLRPRNLGGRPLILALVLLATFILGFINALTHARDAWAMMPGSIILSVIVAVLALATTWLGFAGARKEGL